MADQVSIEVVVALPDRQAVVALEVPQGTTLMEAVALSGLAEKFPEVTVDPARLGVFGKLTGPDTIVNPGDRVEIYRPLLIDPMELRRLRAQQARS